MENLITEYILLHPGTSRKAAEITLNHFKICSFSELQAHEAKALDFADFPDEGVINFSVGIANAGVELEALIEKKQAENPGFTYSEAMIQAQIENPELTALYITESGL